MGFVLQTSRAHNVTVNGGAKYNLPPGEFTIDQSFLSEIGVTSSPSLTSYTAAAIAGADDFNDDDTSIRDVFDIIVSVTREITPSCKPPIIRSYPFVLLSPKSSRNRLEPYVRARGSTCQTYSLTIARSSTYGWLVRSVERLLPYSPKRLRYPVLVIGNSVRAFHLRTRLSHNLTTVIPRLTRSRRSRVRNRPPTCSVTMLFCSSNSGSVTRPSLKSLLALWAS